MKLHRKMLATSMIAAAGAVPLAVVLSTTAAAQPAPTPPVPAIPFLDQLGNAPALLQNLASALAPAGSATGVSPAAATAPAPGATASITLPQTPAVTSPVGSPSTLPGMPGAAAANPLAALMPAGSALSSLLPAATPATTPALPVLPAATGGPAPSLPMGTIFPVSALP
ncbi:hypothetical protein JRC04_19010 [Mycolicibacterium sp. S2-37]|uniref:hypothetical protein n=1 Tax=Mycolicibacterium sp. S2-37 TaxID=2810297 RepID=UPI001A93C608|nr:hypothetical protein [Mycolicibacterium sp. S2-37]MBO0679558.1 hypothetical protein [Mycolicibacterium sp. S2-37]